MVDDGGHKEIHGRSHSRGRNIACANATAIRFLVRHNLLYFWCSVTDSFYSFISPPGVSRLLGQHVMDGILVVDAKSMSEDMALRTIEKWRKK